MAKVAYTARRISTDNPTILKRDIEATLVDVETSFNAVQASIPNHYTTEAPTQVTPFMQVLVHTDFWTPEAITELAAVFIWYVDAIPTRVAESPDGSDNGQWVKLLEIPAVPLS